MNILLISRCPPYPLHLGDRLIPYHLAERLSNRHTIDLLAFYNRPDDPQNVPYYEKYFRTVKLIPERPRTTIALIRRLIRPGGLYPGDAEGSWSPEMWQVINDQVSNTKYDIIQLFGGIHVYEFHHLLRGLPTVITPYESYSLYLRRLLAHQKSLTGRLSIWLQYLAAARYERAMFSGYAATVVLTDNDRQALLKLNPQLPLHVIPNGIALDYFTGEDVMPEPDDIPVLLFIGNFEYAPNVDAALRLGLEIFPQVKRAIPGTRLMLVGNNPPDAICTLKTQDIEVTGHVPDVRPYFEQASVFISPLRFGAGIKNKVLEAMAMGKPLVATAISGEGIGLAEGINVLYGETSEELASAAIRLLNNVDLRKRMGQANRHIIEKSLTWEAVSGQYENLYARIRKGMSPQEP